MTATRNDAGSTRKTCLWCHGLLSPQRPVFLVGTPSGRIVGPFHAGCAERLRLEAKKNPDSNWLKGSETWGEWPSRREETTPW